MQNIELQKKRVPYLFLFLMSVLSLILFGILFIYSSSSAYAIEQQKPIHFFIQKHFIGFIIGFFGLCFVQFFSVSGIKKLNRIAIYIIIFFTVLTLFPSFARTVHGSSRWVSLFGIIFQPSELLKYSLVMLIADYITRFTGDVRYYFFTLLNLFFFIGISLIILLLQPDFGSTVIITIVAIILFFISGHSLKIIFSTTAFFSLIGAALIAVKPYRLQRVLSFLDPWKDPKNKGFQIIQSLTALGSGGIIGQGVGNSKQKFFYLPMHNTDFIFAIIGEEIGLIGLLILIFTYLLFMYSGYKMAVHIKDPYSSLTIIGLVSLISLQAIINMAVVVGLVPPKGISLPFISFGSTALVCNMIAVGVIINIVRKYNKKITKESYATRTKNGSVII